MVMDSFRTKLRRRRNELFRRSSDGQNDEWKFVAFNPSVYPTQQGTVAKDKHQNGSSIILDPNGDYQRLTASSRSNRAPVPAHKSGLRPWALKRASWHDGSPPVPPHGRGTSNKAQRPLPTCPEGLQGPSVPPHDAHLYPGSVPNWYGARVLSEGGQYPFSVPTGRSRPPLLECVEESGPSVVLRTDSYRRGVSLGTCSDGDSPISPESMPPLVPPHGRPTIPPHNQCSNVDQSPAPSRPQHRTPAYSVPIVPSAPPLPPPPLPPLAVFHDPPMVNLPPPPREDTPDSFLSQPLPPTPGVLSPETEEFLSGFSSSDPCGSSITAHSQMALALDYLSPVEGAEGDRIGSGAGNKEQRRSDPGSGPGGHPLSNHLGPSNGNGPDDENFQASTDDADHGVTDSFNNASLENTPNNLSKGHGNQKKRSATSINRSESCKEKQIARKQVRENRKNSDPNIPTSKSGDVDGENHTFHSGSSSNSSLSQSQESPPGNTSEQIEAYASALDNDSDVEADTDLPDWSARLSPEVLEALTSKERKRQDTINEFFHTEQSHVRILKVLQFLFHQPLRQGGYVSTELMDSLFPNMDQILRLHTSFNKAMKKRRMETPLVTCIGDILTSMFAGEEGAQFQCAAAEFVSCQGFALESLKHQQKRDQKLALFLQDQENHPHCRRLQLKDMLPAGFQRLSKYPLLLESLLSYTDRTKHPEEYEQIVRALERSKEILAHVNTAVHNAENHKRLRDIQKKLDQNSLAKSKHGNIEELKGEFDLTKHNLIYEGPLTWKTARGQKNIDIHVLILEDCVVLLQKDSDKFILKYHSMNKSLGKDENKLNLSPIIKFGTCLCREVATDKCAIFIISTQSTSNAQIYELVTSSPMERSTWLRHLHEAQANYNAKEGRNRRSQPPPNLAESDEGSSAPADLKDVDDGVDGDNSESTNSTSENVSSRGKQENLEGGSVPHSAAPGTTSPETISNKTESGYTTAVSVPGSEASGPGTQPPAQGLSSPSGGPRRRLQEVQIIQIVEGPSLIQPSEVTVSQGVVLSAEPVLTPLELLRRKDLKIREELAEKQDLVADILNIPRRDFESVADVAGEAGLANKEPRELVLGAIFQAKRLQETLNETQNLREGAIIASHASLVDGGGGGSTPAYQTSFETMDKLLSISGALTQFLNSLMVLVSERDEERERMRRELVSSRDRVHQLHMQQQQNSNVEPTTATPSTVQPQNGSSSDLPEATSTLPVLEMVTPNSSRPSSFVYNNSFTTEHSESADLTNIEREDKYIEPVKSVAPEVTLPSDTPTTDSEKRNSGDVTGLSVSGGEDVGAVFGVKAPPNPPPEDSTNPPVEETKEGVVAT